MPVSASIAMAMPSLLPPATEESIVKLISFVTWSPNLLLGLVWKHAFWEQLREGFRRGMELFKDKDVKWASCEVQIKDG